MNRQIVRLGVGLLVCYVALFGMVNYVQVLRADELNDDYKHCYGYAYSVAPLP